MLQTFLKMPQNAANITQNAATMTHFVAWLCYVMLHGRTYPEEEMYVMGVVTRVTRLGEFLPIERLFPLGIFLKIKDVAQIV
jgi:hypothetical protein